MQTTLADCSGLGRYNGSRLGAVGRVQPANVGGGRKPAFSHGPAGLRKLPAVLNMKDKPSGTSAAGRYDLFPGR
jgi:hypothetical protein